MKAVIAIIVVIILAAGAYALLHTPSASAPAQTTTTSTTVVATTTDTTSTGGDVSVGGTVSVGTPVTITYDGTSFSPKTVTIKVGQSVTWMNQSTSGMWIASNPHPVHTGYDGTTEAQHCAPGYTGPAPLDECSGNNSFTFTFTKVGTWGYHNHEGAEDGGTVIVTQ